MAVTIESVVQFSERSWIFTVSSNLPNPLYRIYRYGQLIHTTRENQFLISVSPGESAEIEILDDASAPQPGFPQRVVLTWAPIANAAQYRIDEFISGNWVQRQLFTATGARERWVSRILEDQTLHKFRIVPISENGIEGTPLEFSKYMIRRPEALPEPIDYTIVPATGALIFNA